ncbi:MAG: hypothetical protein K2I88_00475 [Anaeroplasmataceae bacterium]|nr:hypothetical protein [Anaeroplasmataceae bacterium]
MRNIKKIMVGVVAALGVTALTACNKTEEQTKLVDDVLGKIVLIQDKADVSEDFVVPKTVVHQGTTYDITWTSSDSSVISFEERTEKDGVKYYADLHRPFDGDKDIVLTASTTAADEQGSLEFKTTVLSIDETTAIESEISKLVKSSYGAKTEVNLPASSKEYQNEITFTYTLGGEYTTTKLEGNKLTIDPTLSEKPEAVVLKVKATCGSKVVNKDVNTKASLRPVYLTVTEALAQPVNSMIYVQGKIKSVVSETYGNFWIVDEDGKEIEIYGLYTGLIEECYDADNKWTKKGTRYDAWDASAKLAVGDYVYAYGTRAVYKDTQEVSNCVFLGSVEGTPVGTVKEAKDTEKGDFLAVYGKVKSIASTTYGNLYLEDSEGNEIYVYGLYSGKVSECYPGGTWTSSKGVRYDKMEDKPVVGDVIAVYGPMDEYKGTQQVKNGILLYYVSKTERATTTKPEEPKDKTVTGTTIEFKSLGYANAENVNKITFTDGTLTFAQGTNENNSPKYYTNGEAVRMYGSNTLTIKSDKKIAKVEFVLVVSEKDKAYAFTAENCSISAGTMDYTTSTWTGDANEIVLSYTPTSGQFRIAKVIVTYAE